MDNTICKHNPETHCQYMLPRICHQMPTHAITQANPLHCLIIPCKICKIELLLFPLKAAAAESKPLPNHLMIPLLFIGKRKDNESMYMTTMWKQPKHEESSKKKYPCNHAQYQGSKHAQQTWKKALKRSCMQIMFNKNTMKACTKTQTMLRKTMHKGKKIKQKASMQVQQQEHWGSKHVQKTHKRKLNESVHAKNKNKNHIQLKH